MTDQAIAILARIVASVDDPELRAQGVEALLILIRDGHRDGHGDPSTTRGAIKTRRWREKKRSQQAVTVTVTVPPEVPPEVPPYNPLPTPLLPPSFELSNESSCSSPAKDRREREREFEEIWQLFPRKVGKGHALKAYVSARKQTDFETIRSGVERHREQSAGLEPQFIPHPATWLNGKRWLDEPTIDRADDTVPEQRGPSAPPSEALLEQARKFLQ